MMAKMIATWRMAYESFGEIQNKLLTDDANSLTVEAISFIEDCKVYKSVGYGGLPNEDCIVEQDSAFMSGKNLSIGAVMGVKNIKNPIRVAEKLSSEKYNNFLVGPGAEKYATINGFEFKNMLTKKSKDAYLDKKEKIDKNHITPYDGHDTVGVITLDSKGNMAVGTSTSGLFFKKEGRVGDSALCGSGFYCDDDFGACSATGLGEDITKGVLSYEVVRKLSQNIPVQEACDKTLWDFDSKLKKKYNRNGAMSIISMDKNGNFGVSTNVEFTFVVMDEKEIFAYIVKPDIKTKKTVYEKLSKKDLEKYISDRGFDPKTKFWIE